MKRIMFFLLFLLQLSTANAATINRLVFFGDSLSDNGNLYALTFHFLPKSPPYYMGRFSNGRVWAEELFKYYPGDRTLDYKIYAYAGATAIYHAPTTKFISPTTLTLEVDRYLLDELFYNKDDVVFGIWIGGNDYLYNPDANADELTTKVVDSIDWAIKTLHYYGAKHFLILNMPNLGKIPKARLDGIQLPLQTLSILHNQKLDAAVQAIQTSNPDIKITVIRIDNIFDEAMNDTQKFNEKFHVNVINTVNACWMGGYLLKSFSMAQSKIELDLTTNKTTPAVNVKAMSEMIASTPALLEAYQVGKAYERGVHPCAHPETYLFWDTMHPSAIVHNVLAQIVAEKLKLMTSR